MVASTSSAREAGLRLASRRLRMVSAAESMMISRACRWLTPIDSHPSPQWNVSNMLACSSISTVHSLSSLSVKPYFS